MTDGATPGSGGAVASAVPSGRKEQAQAQAQTEEAQKSAQAVPRSVRSSRETRSRQKEDSSVTTSAAKWYKRRLGSGGAEVETEKKIVAESKEVAPPARPAKKKNVGKPHVQKKTVHINSGPSLAGHLPALVFLVLSAAGLVLWWRSMASLAPAYSDQRVDLLEVSVKRTSDWMQEQLRHMDGKISKQVQALKEELEDRLDSEVRSGRKERDMMLARLDDIQASVRVVQQQIDSSQLAQQEAEAGGLTEEETYGYVKSLFDEWVAIRDEQGISMEEVHAAARHIVQEEVEKYAADGIGRVDYAVESGGGRVVDHSEGFFHHRSRWTLLALSFLPGSHHRHPLAERVLQPSFGEPGHCLPLRGSNVYVDISLRMAIQPEAVTLEHVSKLVAFDLSSAPQDFQIFGWHANETQAHRAAVLQVQKPLGKFKYDLEGPRIQTFNLSDSSEQRINMVRLHVLSNYGSQTHTCLYRFRVHGSPSPL